MGNPDDAAVHRASGFSVVGSRAGRLEMCLGWTTGLTKFGVGVIGVQELVPLHLSITCRISHVGLALHVCPWRQALPWLLCASSGLVLGPAGQSRTGADLCLTPSPAAMSLVCLATCRAMTSRNGQGLAPEASHVHLLPGFEGGICSGLSCLGRLVLVALTPRLL